MVQLTNSAFSDPIDIAQRVADHLGQKHLLALNDDSKLAEYFNESYAKLRQAELRRNIWRFSVKRAALRAIITDEVKLPNGTLILPTLQATFPTWSSVTTYLYGSIVSSGGALWLNVAPSNLANTPGAAGSGWVNYFGSICVQPWDAKDVYYSGEMAYVSTGIGTYNVYLALLNGTNEDPTVADAWDATLTYPKDAIITKSSVTYKSKVDMNLGNDPATQATAWATTSLTNSQQWVQIVGMVLTSLHFVYPIGSGPTTQQATRNVFMLPYGYLRQAPQDPKSGAVSFLGASSGLSYDDWTFEGNYITSRMSTPIILRFAADVTDVTGMDPMFCEGLANRIAYEGCESITQSTERLKNITGSYGKNMVEARTVNGIEEGPVEPPEDDWVSCRY